MAEVQVPEGNAAPDAGLEVIAPEQPSGEGAEHVVADTPQSVNIDGTEYSLEDVRSGMLRQADYTRKTQEVAAERQRLQQAETLWNALYEDPAGALEAIQEHFAEQLAAPGEVDPDARRWSEVESFMQREQQRETVAAINGELQTLESKFGKFDHDALLNHAIDNGIGNLEAALIHQRATTPALQAQMQHQAAEAAALAAKQGLPPVAGGGSAAGSTQRGGKPIVRPRDALAEALAEAGVDSITSLL